MNSLDIALQNIETWQTLAQANNIKQSYNLWREDGVWQSKINEGN
jgi:hypothetical protein